MIHGVAGPAEQTGQRPCEQYGHDGAGAGRHRHERGGEGEMAGCEQ